MSEKEREITLIIDEQEIKVSETKTIMEAADEKIGVHIPRLCYHPHLSLEGACRVCIVKVEGLGFVTSCSTQVSPGMVVSTNSPEIRQARRDIVELILDNHPRKCNTCSRNANCELQRLAYSQGIRHYLYQGVMKHPTSDSSSFSVKRYPEKCILCGRCVRVCSEIQGINNLSQQERGFNTVVAPAFYAKMDKSVCVQCGQCISACPTAAFVERDHTERVWQALNDKDKIVIAQTAPSVRAAIGEGFGLPAGSECTGQMVTSLRLLGFDKVFDTNLGADLTIMEEANELINRIKNQGVLPLITSCSPGWITFMEKFYPELMLHMSTCRSPMQMLSALIKTYYARILKRDPKDIYVVGIMPCVAKKYEIERAEHIIDNIKLTDAVLTTRELVWMIKSFGVDFNNISKSDFDKPLGVSTGAGDIFGTTGGVMEAALRTAVYVITGKAPDDIEFVSVRAVEGLREHRLVVDDLELNIAVANGLVNARHLLDDLLSGNKNYHVIEVMACPSGCIGGGGQPYPSQEYDIFDKELLAKRASVLYNIDRNKSMRSSHENEVIQTLYKDFLVRPGSKIAHELLHTTYKIGMPRGISDKSIDRDKDIQKLLAEGKSKLPPQTAALIEQSSRSENPQSYLIEVLRTLQNEEGFLADENLAAIAYLMKIPTATLYGVATFYHYFRLKPRGKYLLEICLGTACYVRGGNLLLSKIKELLGINLNETTKDGLFTLEATRCLGMCALAPILKVGDDIYPRLKVDKVQKIINKYKE